MVISFNKTLIFCMNTPAFEVKDSFPYTYICDELLNSMAGQFLDLQYLLTIQVHGSSGDGL